MLTAQRLAILEDTILSREGLSILLVEQIALYRQKPGKDLHVHATQKYREGSALTLPITEPQEVQTSGLQPKMWAGPGGLRRPHLQTAMSSLHDK